MKEIRRGWGGGWEGVERGGGLGIEQTCSLFDDSKRAVLGFGRWKEGDGGRCRWGGEGVGRDEEWEECEAITEGEGGGGGRDYLGKEGIEG